MVNCYVTHFLNMGPLLSIELVKIDTSSLHNYHI